MTYDIQPISVTCVRNHEALIKEHWETTAQDKHLGLDPDWLAYTQLEARGLLISLGVITNGKLVGYSATYLGSGLRYAEQVATNHLLFLSPAYRSSGMGLALMSATRDAARAKGARTLIWQAAVDSPLDRILSARRGILTPYKLHTEII